MFLVVMVLAKRTHPVICLVVIAAFLLNLVAVAGGVVVCQDPAGESSIELACDHDHCPTTATTPTVETEHEHDSGGCWCSTCPCEDTYLNLDVAPFPRDDDIRASTTPNSINFILVPGSAPPRWMVSRLLLGNRPPPALDRTLRQLRTVILIV